MLPAEFPSGTLVSLLWVLTSVLPAAGVRAAQVQPVEQPTTEPVHGLTGFYYTSASASGPRLDGFSLDEHWLPTPNKPPDAVRVDPQIAFGQAKGFVIGSKRFEWWMPRAEAVIWK